MHIYPGICKDTYENAVNPQTVKGLEKCLQSQKSQYISHQQIFGENENLIVSSRICSLIPPTFRY